jgi:SH3 domain-containing protein
VRLISHLGRTLAVTLALVSLSVAQETGSRREREYPFSAAAVKAALKNIGAYDDLRLPTLEGFIKLEGVHLEGLTRPFCQYKIELVPTTPDKTLVRVKANVTAWQGSQGDKDAGYLSLESNGRLESDLLDRLNDYLQDKPADATAMTQRIAALHTQRLEAEHHLAELEEQLRNLQSPTTQSDSEFVTVLKPRVSVLSAPADNSSVLVRAQLDDEFQVLERRGEWLQVSLEGSHTGWVRRSLVQSSLPANSGSPGQAKAMPADSFTIIREMPSDFSGDWEPLKGKRALYVWARPQGSTINETGNKLQFAQSVFMERYRQVAHSSQDPWAGIVVIFLDQRGGVAAASIDDIRQWDDGSLTQQAFLKRCSLDPPSAFLRTTGGRDSGPQKR